MKHKRITLLLVALLMTATSLSFAGTLDRGERRIRISTAKKAENAVEIVVVRQTPILKLAAEELQNHIKTATGITAPVVSAPTEGKVSLILGDNEFSRAAGLDVNTLASEGFFIKRQGSRIYLLGKDSTNIDPQSNPWYMWMKRGTLTAVYDFLERFLGVRFYFAGEHGTIVPENQQLTLPLEIDIIDRPDLISRENYSGPNSVWYDKNDKYLGSIKGKNLNFLRHRYSDSHIPFGHGLDYINLIQRFGKTHPEYFALTHDNRRYKEADHVHPGHICFHSNVVEEIYQDVKAYLTGKPASSRGIKHWDVNFACNSVVSVMPVDWLFWCHCEKCTKIAPGGRGYQTDPQAAQAISNAVWKYTSDIARRLTRENINATVTQMAYGALKRLPECEIPKNVSVQLAVNGLGIPAHWQSDLELLKKWSKRFNGKISIWTYPGKHMSKRELKGIPAMMHRETGKYLQLVRDYIYGCFLESETDYEIFHYLNYYTFGKVAWNLDTDLDKLLDEHYQLMFGAGAGEMKKFFDELEDLWCKKVTGKIVDTAYGPDTQLPSDFDLWTKIYSPAKLKELNSRIDNAKKAVNGDKKIIGRLEFMRREMLGHLMKRSEQFAKDQAIVGDWEFHISEPIALRPHQGDVGEVTTKLTVKDNKGYYVFIFECSEPFMKNVKADCKEKDKIGVFMDSCVEVLLNPSGDRNTYYHIGANLNGTVSDSIWNRNEKKPDYSWDSNAGVIVQKNANGFIINIHFPKKILGEIKADGFPVNFARHRVITGDNAKKVKETNYQWSPVPGRSFHDIEQWGVMKTGAPDNKNLLKDGGFDTGNVWLPNTVGAWYVWSSNQKELVKIKNTVRDRYIFMNGTASLRLTNWNKHNIAAGQKFKGLKPNTRYRLSFFLRTRDLKGAGGAGAYLTIGGRNFSFPGIRITGDSDWHQRNFDFKTASDVTPATECQLGLWIWNCAGQAWYDKVSITEIK